MQLNRTRPTSGSEVIERHFLFISTSVLIRFRLGRRFLREFAKFRYGVFDVREQTPAEHDGLFPGFFCPPAIVSNATVSNATGRSIPFARYASRTMRATGLCPG